MLKWIFIVLLVLASPFLLGLRIDFKALDEHLHKKPDPNAAALIKMGLDPAQYGTKKKPWWTFKEKDNVIKNLSKWNPVQQMSDESWKTSQQIKKNLGPSPEELMNQALAQQAKTMKARQEMMAKAAEGDGL